MRQQHRVQQQSTAEESAEISETVETVEEEGESAAEYDAAYTGLANYGGNVWRYQVNGKIQWGYTGLVQYYGTWYYVEKGTLNWNYTGLTNYYGTWYYIESGVLNWGYTGLTNYYNTWYYVEKGVLNWNYTGLTEYYGTKYWVENGLLQWNPAIVSRFSELTDKYALTPMIALYILQMCNNSNDANYIQGPVNCRGYWNGIDTTWDFTLKAFMFGGLQTMNLDLTTGIAEVWFTDSKTGDKEKISTINFLTRVGESEEGTNTYWGKKFFKNFAYEKSYVWILYAKVDETFIVPKIQNYFARGKKKLIIQEKQQKIGLYFLLWIKMEIKKDIWLLILFTASVGRYHNAAVTKKNELYVWGANESGQVGDGSTSDQEEPVLIFSDAKTISLGDRHSAADAPERSCGSPRR